MFRRLRMQLAVNGGQWFWLGEILFWFDRYGRTGREWMEKDRWVLFFFQSCSFYRYFKISCFIPHVPYLGSKILLPGELCGKLNPVTAQEMGLLIGTPVATSITDGQCGDLGLVGCQSSSLSTDLTLRLGQFIEYENKIRAVVEFQNVLIKIVRPLLKRVSAQLRLL